MLRRAAILALLAVAGCSPVAPGSISATIMADQDGREAPALEGLEVRLYVLEERESFEVDVGGVTVVGDSCEALLAEFAGELVAGDCIGRRYWKRADEPAITGVTGRDGRVVLAHDPAVPYSLTVDGGVTAEDRACWSGSGQFRDGESRVTIRLSVACA